MLRNLFMSKNKHKIFQHRHIAVIFFVITLTTRAVEEKKLEENEKQIFEKRDLTAACINSYSMHDIMIAVC